MPLFKRLCLLGLVFLASACGSASFKGKGKSHHDGRDQEPIPCASNATCPPTPCTNLTAEQIAALAAAASTSQSGIVTTIVPCTPDKDDPTQNDDDAGQNPGQNPGQN